MSRRINRPNATSQHSNSVFRLTNQAEDINPTVIKQARKTGQLNLTNKGLVTVPNQVWTINLVSQQETKCLSLSFNATDSDRWWDQVDLTKLYLSSNKLSAISPEIRNLNALQVLDLHDNQLVGLPPEVGELQNLKHLNLSRNKISILPDSLFNLQELSCLNLSHNNLTKLNEDIGNLASLQTLVAKKKKFWFQNPSFVYFSRTQDLSHNGLTNLPHTVGFLTRVTSFLANNNKLQQLPPEMGCMGVLQHLDLSQNDIRAVPPDLGELLHLVQLYLQNNRLIELPELSRCRELKELYVGNNHLKEVKIEALEAVHNLVVLDLRENKLTTLPERIICLQKLERLDLTNNYLTGLPSALGKLPHLKALQLEGNPLRSIRRDVLQRGTVQLLKFLRGRIENSPEMQRKDLPVGSENRDSQEKTFTDILEESNFIDVFTLRKTRTLDYSCKAVTTVPQELFAAAAEAEVSIVNLSKNDLLEMPEGLKLLMAWLNELNVSGNKITCLPVYLEQAQRLSFLDLSFNNVPQITAFNFGSLLHLREIWLSGNKFRKLPPSLYEAPKLEIILASDNQIEEINVAGLMKLTRLASLDLRNNNISCVPPELGNVVQLRSLQLEGNLFRQPRPQILAKGTHSLLEYLRDRIVN